jgi:hypothetical protein
MPTTTRTTTKQSLEPVELRSRLKSLNLTNVYPNNKNNKKNKKNNKVKSKPLELRSRVKKFKFNVKQD